MKNAAIGPVGRVIKIVTPKKFVLNGLWFGPAKPRRVIVHVHGLGSSAFRYEMVTPWVDARTAVITFSNRGHDSVARVKRMKADGSTSSITAGSVHEVFTDCTDDIQGAVDFARRSGARSIVLSGHSTGCQKIVFYASRRPDRAVKGLVLLAPISDYAGIQDRVGKGVYAAALKSARALVRRGQAHELLPAKAWYAPIDAQRWLSLYTPDSAEEIFCYAQEGGTPRTLRRVKLPQLVLLAQDDVCMDRPALDIARWFDSHASADCGTIQIIPGTGHGFEGAEKAVLRLFRWWSRGLG